MLKDRELDHLGIATSDLAKSVNWYVDTMGFEVYGECIAEDGTPIKFLKNGQGVKYEFYELENPEPGVIDHIDHISFVSDDIEKDYEYCVSKGCKITTDGIEQIGAFWDNGCRFFKIEGPGGEKVEFDQIL